MPWAWRREPRPATLESRRGPARMTGAALVETVDFYRIDASTKLNSRKRALGAARAVHDAGPDCPLHGELVFRNGQGYAGAEPGAGVGTLTAALAERLCATVPRPRSVEFVCYEIDAMLSNYLGNTLGQVEDDFILLRWAGSTAGPVQCLRVGRIGLQPCYPQSALSEDQQLFTIYIVFCRQVRETSALLFLGNYAEKS